jgi:hypothetical protein
MRTPERESIERGNSYIDDILYLAIEKEVGRGKFGGVERMRNDAYSDGETCSCSL